MLDYQVDLAVGVRAGERHVQVGLPQVPVVFGDFVLPNRVVTPGVPGKLGDDSMILMRVHLAVAEDQTGIELALDGLERVLDVGRDGGEVALPKVVNDDV